MPNGSSNIDDIDAWLDQVVASIDFTLPGADESLGRDMAGTVAEGIANRSVPDALDPSGNKWADNEERYATWKAQTYDAYQPGILTGQMLSLLSLLGETTLGPDEVSMVYGIDEPASSTRNGAPLPRSSDDTPPPTDRQKAQWFTEGGREFYALDDPIADACVEDARKAIDRYLEGP